MGGLLKNLKPFSSLPCGGGKKKEKREHSVNALGKKNSIRGVNRKENDPAHVPRPGGMRVGKGGPVGRGSHRYGDCEEHESR